MLIRKIEMNVTLIIGIALLLIGIVSGFKTGLAKGIANLVALIITLLTLALIIMLLESFKAGETRNTIYTLVIMSILGSVYGTVRFVLRSMKSVSKLPLIRFFDGLMGIIIGEAWMFILYMAFLTLGVRGYLGNFSNIIINDVETNLFLTILCKYNIFL